MSLIEKLCDAMDPFKCLQASTPNPSKWRETPEGKILLEQHKDFLESALKINKNNLGTIGFCYLLERINFIDSELDCLKKESLLGKNFFDQQKNVYDNKLLKNNFEQIMLALPYVSTEELKKLLDMELPNPLNEKEQNKIIKNLYHFLIRQAPDTAQTKSEIFDLFEGLTDKFRLPRHFIRNSRLLMNIRHMDVRDDAEDELKTIKPLVEQAIFDKEFLTAFYSQIHQIYHQNIYFGKIILDHVVDWGKEFNHQTSPPLGWFQMNYKSSFNTNYLIYTDVCSMHQIKPNSDTQSLRSLLEIDLPSLIDSEEYVRYCRVMNISPDLKLPFSLGPWNNSSLDYIDYEKPSIKNVYKELQENSKNIPKSFLFALYCFCASFDPSVIPPEDNVLFEMPSSQEEYYAFAKNADRPEDQKILLAFKTMYDNFLTKEELTHRLLETETTTSHHNKKLRKM